MRYCNSRYNSVPEQLNIVVRLLRRKIHGYRIHHLSHNNGQLNFHIFVLLCIFEIIIYTSKMRVTVVDMKSAC